MFADGPRPAVERRVKLFQVMLYMDFVEYDHLKQAWIKNARILSYSDLPLAKIYFPKVMVILNSKFPIHLPDWEVVDHEDEE